VCAINMKTETDFQLQLQHPKISLVLTNFLTISVHCMLPTMPVQHTNRTCQSIAELHVKLVDVLIESVRIIIKIVQVSRKTITATLEGFTCSTCVQTPANFVENERDRWNSSDIPTVDSRRQ